MIGIDGLKILEIGVYLDNYDGDIEFLLINPQIMNGVLEELNKKLLINIMKKTLAVKNGMNLSLYKMMMF